ncbi:unnamed protein product [Arabidopsis arenosa]|uniref:NAC domain-containing protein n=1 Tax=Arabidopsis arenosa TaxID=38785 RepID=A0A8S1ZJW3_ARAAE|nr:unnamed protein product [Arabidopsis arenosa]
MESTDSSGGPPPPPPQPNLPPGFRFHPTDEELVIHYLKRKADSVPLPVAIIADVNLYKFDPWELPAKASFGEQECGKPPKGVKSDWIMHEYRLTDNKPTHICDFGNKKNSLRLDDWVLCRIYKKNNNNNDPTAIYDGGGGGYGGGNYSMNHNFASGSKQEQLFPPVMMMTSINQDSGIGSSSSPNKRYNGGGVGDCSTSLAATPLLQNQGGIYQLSGLNWYS